MDFIELTDDEVMQYADSHIGIQKEINWKNTYKEEINNIKKRIEKVVHNITIAEECVINNDYENSYKNLHNNAVKLSRIATMLNKLPITFGEKDGIEKVKRDYIEKKDVIFERKGNILVIKLPELLPHKQQFDVSTGQMRYYYDIDTFRASYYEVFDREFQKGRYKLLGTKVIIWYKHHFSNINNAPDPDNIDTKVMTDIITTYILRDDSFIYCNQLHTGIEDKRDYTEIIILSEKELKNVL